MPDRHWMEKWKWEHALEGEAKPRLVRKSDGKQAEGWKHAAKIEGAGRGVSSTDMLTNPKYAMVPLKELYPDEVRVPEPILAELGERSSASEMRGQQVEPEDLPWAARTDERRHSTLLLFLGWILTILAALLFLASGSLLMGLVLVLAFFGGAAIATHITRR